MEKNLKKKMHMKNIIKYTIIPPQKTFQSPA